MNVLTDLCAVQREAQVVALFVAFEMGHQANYTEIMLEEWNKKSNRYELCLMFFKQFEISTDEFSVETIIRKSRKIKQK